MGNQQPIEEFVDADQFINTARVIRAITDEEFMALLAREPKACNGTVQNASRYTPTSTQNPSST